MKKLSEILVVTVLLVVSTILCLSAEASDTHYSEDFTTTTYKDVLNTTALWDTVSGELKLPPFTIQLVGSYPSISDPRKLVVHGDYAFVASAGHPDLYAMDISDPENPTVVNTLNFTDFSNNLEVSGNYLYATNGHSGMVIVDISDPANPVITATINTMQHCQDIEVHGDCAFVAGGFSGLIIFDITDPTSPVELDRAGVVDYAHCVSVEGDYAYVSDEDWGIDVFDVSDPTNIIKVADYRTPNSYGGKNAVSGDYLFLKGAYNGPQFGEHDLLVLDISDPTNPTLIGVLDTSDGVCGEIILSGNYLYTFEYMGGTQYDLLMVDISDPSNPSLLQRYNTTQVSGYLTLHGDYAFFGAGTAGLQVLKIAEPVLPPVLAGIVSLPHYGGYIKTAGDHVYVGGDNAGLQVIDISDPQNPIIVGSVDTPHRAIHIDVHGNYAYVTDYWPIGSNTFYSIDVSDPTNPMIAGSYGTPDHIQGLDVEGDYAYVCNGAYGFKVLDISDPTNPTLAGNLTTSDYFHIVTVSGDYAYVGLGAGGGFLTVDISDPTNPTLAGSIDTPSHVYHVNVCGDYAFVCCSEAGFFVMDITDPTNPVIVGSYNTPGNAIFAAVEGDYAYIADRNQGVHVLDVTDPTSPTLLGSYMAPNVANYVAIAGDHLFLTTGYVGYLVVLNAFQRSLDTESDTGRSLAVNPLKKEIAEVQLNTTEVGTITWSVSADNGVHWEPIVPGAGWHSFTNTGSELLWKSQHFYDLSQPGVNPTCSFLEMEWIYSHVEVGFDIKPGSCPNPFNVKDDPEEDDNSQGLNKEYAKPRKGGVLPAAIVGSADLDVNDIDVSTILLEGIEPLRSNYEDVIRPVDDGGACACTDLGPDGYIDLTLKFSRIALAEVLGSVGNGEVVELTITGSLLDGTSFEGSDCVTIVGKRSSVPRFEEIDLVQLNPPVPNPFNPVTSISYSVPDACVVSLEIFDSSGKLIVRILDNVTVSRGMHTVEWRGVDRYGRAIDSGVYFYRLIAGNEIISRKMVLLR